VAGLDSGSIAVRRAAERESVKDCGEREPRLAPSRQVRNIDFDVAQAVELRFPNDPQAAGARAISCGAWPA
jgi:hypothetical protein